MVDSRSCIAMAPVTLIRFALAASLFLPTTGTLVSSRGCSSLKPISKRFSKFHRAFPRARKVQSSAGRDPLVVKCQGSVEPGDMVVVTGSTGGVGQLVVANLLSKGYRVRAVTRSLEKGRALFGDDNPNLEVVIADQRYKDTLGNMFEGAAGVVSCSGTTAFPSSRWDDNNGPEMTDKVGLHNIIDESLKHMDDIKRFVLVSSTGVVRRKQFPFAIMNAFGVLDYKKMSEEYLEKSGLPYTIIRPGRLTDGPYTSYDLNTLLKATSGNRQNVEISTEDNLNGEMSRITLAEAVVQAMQLPCTEGSHISMMSRQGEGPGSQAEKWKELYQSTLG